MAPATTARTTSLMVTSKAWATPLILSSGRDVKATSRRGVIGASNGRRGALKGTERGTTSATMVDQLARNTHARPHRSLQRSSAEQRASEHRRKSAGELGQVPGSCLWDLGTWRRWCGNIGFQREERRHELHAGTAVHEGVVQLRHDAQTVVFEPVDHVHLPQGVATIQLASGDVRDEGGQVHRGDGSGQPHRLDVTVEVDSGIIHPPGHVEAQRHRDQTPLQWRHQVDPGSDIVPHRADTIAGGHGRGIEDHHRHAVGDVVGRPLGRKEHCVQPAQPPHVGLTPSPLGWRIHREPRPCCVQRGDSRHTQTLGG